MKKWKYFSDTDIYAAVEDETGLHVVQPRTPVGSVPFHKTYTGYQRYGLGGSSLVLHYPDGLLKYHNLATRTEKSLLNSKNLHIPQQHPDDTFFITEGSRTLYIVKVKDGEVVKFKLPDDATLMPVSPEKSTYRINLQNYTVVMRRTEDGKPILYTFDLEKKEFRRRIQYDNAALVGTDAFITGNTIDVAVNMKKGRVSTFTSLDAHKLTTHSLGKPIKEIHTAGWRVSPTSTLQNSYTVVYLLTEDGEVYSLGDYSYGMLGISYERRKSIKSLSQDALTIPTKIKFGRKDDEKIERIVVFPPQKDKQGSERLVLFKAESGRWYGLGNTHHFLGRQSAPETPTPVEITDENFEFLFNENMTVFSLGPEEVTRLLGASNRFPVPGQRQTYSKLAKLALTVDPIYYRKHFQSLLMYSC